MVQCIHLTQKAYAGASYATFSNLSVPLPQPAQRATSTPSVALSPQLAQPAALSSPSTNPEPPVPTSTLPQPSQPAAAPPLCAPLPSSKPALASSPDYPPSVSFKPSSCLLPRHHTQTPFNPSQLRYPRQLGSLHSSPPPQVLTSCLPPRITPVGQALLPVSERGYCVSPVYPEPRRASRRPLCFFAVRSKTRRVCH